jgi:hypothetical protein
MEKELKLLKIAWPKDTGPALFVNNVTIQTDENLISYLTFFQAIPPVVMGTPEEKREYLESLETIEARPMVKLAMAKEDLRKLAEVLNTQLKITHQ